MSARLSSASLAWKALRRSWPPTRTIVPPHRWHLCDQIRVRPHSQLQGHLLFHLEQLLDQRHQPDPPDPVPCERNRPSSDRMRVQTIQHRQRSRRGPQWSRRQARRTVSRWTGLHRLFGGVAQVLLSLCSQRQPTSSLCASARLLPSLAPDLLGDSASRRTKRTRSLARG